MVGTLSSSTQMYSGSLGTSPKRGFKMRSQRVSADFRVIDGSPAAGRPAMSRIIAQPVTVSRHATTKASRRTAIRALP